MGRTMFQYPGGKSHLVSDLREIMPHHKCYVEGFGGSGAVILNKPKAEVNIYNDLDSDLVHFFTVFREEPERLIEYVNKIPYSFEYYEEVAEAFYDDRLEGKTLVGGSELGNEIKDYHVARAAIFFFLRYSQFGAKYHGKSGFGRSKVLNQAETWANAKERLHEFIDYWNDVTIENVSYEKLIDSYDSEETLFYFDPPYIGTEQYYRECDFDHQLFCEHLEEIEGYWIVSYDKIPEELEKYNRVSQESTNFIDSGVKGESKETEEIFVFNFDPDKVRKHSSTDQKGLGDMIQGDQGVKEDKEPETLSYEEDNTEDDGGWLSDAI